jgi:membrane-bound metal-dependent hydrolase YbcI (DUF457 family)
LRYKHISLENMPNSKTHLIIGAGTGAVVNVLLQTDRMTMDHTLKFDWNELLLCTAIGAGAGLLPDILEPADSPNHRAFFHSIAMAALVAYSITGKHTKKWSPTTLLFWGVASVAYLSHLGADACTPKSIRLI